MSDDDEINAGHRFEHRNDRPGRDRGGRAKAGIIGMTNSLAREFGCDNIRANAIAPGAVMTEKQLRLWYDEKSAAAIAGRQMIKHRLEPEEIARAALFLAADDSRMITKQCLVVDAGLR